MIKRGIFSSESVTEGHPDKVADQISDSILDAILKEDPYSRVACETMAANGFVLLTGEITTKAKEVDYVQIARNTLKEIGYTNSTFGIIKINSSFNNQTGNFSQVLAKAAGASSNFIFLQKFSCRFRLD